jgi:hypothetical protein
MNKSQHTQAELQAMLWEYLASDRVVPRRLEGWMAMSTLRGPGVTEVGGPTLRGC